MPKHFSTLGLSGLLESFSDEKCSKARVLLERLLKLEGPLGFKVWIERDLGEALEAEPSRQKPLSALAQESDLLISLGGDGSLLRLSRETLQHQKPILGINIGNLGFLTDLRASDPLEDVFTQLQKGDYTLSEHQPLWAQSESRREYAVNEILLRGSEGIVHWQVFSGDELLLEQASDGLFFSTPIGSTGHALSAGGPIVHPGVPCLLMTPLCSHNLSSRPIVLPSSLKLRVTLSPKSPRGGLWFFDGRLGGALTSPEETLHIQYAEGHALKLLHIPTHSFFRNYKEKLGWEGQPKRIS